MFPCENRCGVITPQPGLRPGGKAHDIHVRRYAVIRARSTRRPCIGIGVQVDQGVILRASSSTSRRGLLLLARFSAATYIRPLVSVAYATEPREKARKPVGPVLDVPSGVGGHGQGYSQSGTDWGTPECDDALIEESFTGIDWRDHEDRRALDEMSSGIVPAVHFLAGRARMVSPLPVETTYPTEWVVKWKGDEDMLCSSPGTGPHPPTHRQSVSSR